MKKIIIDKNTKYKKIFWLSCFLIMSIVSFLLYFLIKKTIKKGGNKIENAAQKNIMDLKNQTQEKTENLINSLCNRLEKIEYNVNNNINDFKTQVQKTVEEKILNEIKTSAKENISEIKEHLKKQIDENIHEVKEHFKKQIDQSINEVEINLNKQIDENIHEVKEHLNESIDKVKENFNPLKLLFSSPKKEDQINKEDVAIMNKFKNKVFNCLTYWLSKSQIVSIS